MFMKSVIVSIPGTNNYMLNRKLWKQKKNFKWQANMEYLLEKYLKYMYWAQCNILFKTINLLIIYTKLRYTSVAEIKLITKWN